MPTSAAPARSRSAGSTSARWRSLIGTLGVVLLALRSAARRGVPGLERLHRPLLGLALAAALTALGTGAGLLGLQAAEAGGAAALGRVLVNTNYGHNAIARAVLLLALVGVLVALRRSPRHGALLATATCLGLALVVPLALVSHAASIDGARSAATLVIALHLLTAALWVGGVVALAFSVAVLVRADRREAARGLAASFAGYAALCVALVAITGIASVGVHVRSLDALFDTGYGQTLIVKALLFLLAGAVGLATMIAVRSRPAPGALRAVGALPRWRRPCSLRSWFPPRCSLPARRPGHLSRRRSRLPRLRLRRRRPSAISSCPLPPSRTGRAATSSLSASTTLVGPPLRRPRR